MYSATTVHRVFRPAIRLAPLVLTATVGFAAAATPASAALFTLFALPPSLTHPSKIAPGPGDTLWFTQSDYERPGAPENVLGQITSGGVATALFVPAGSEPHTTTIGPDGAIWYSAYRETGSVIGHVTAAGVRELALPRRYRVTGGIVTGPDGALWFITLKHIGRLAPDGRMTFFAVPSANYLEWIVAGRDGALWFADSESPMIGRITTTGAVRRFPVPIPEGVDGLAVGADGALWFTSSTGERVGRMTTAGRIRMYRLSDPEDGPYAITTAADGAAWFTRTLGVARITQGGELTELTIPESDDESSLAAGITAAPGGAIWLTLQTEQTLGSSTLIGQIGKIDVLGSADEILVTRITSSRLHGRRGTLLRVPSPRHARPPACCESTMGDVSLFAGASKHAPATTPRSCGCQGGRAPTACNCVSPSQRRRAAIAHR